MKTLGWIIGALCAVAVIAVIGFGFVMHHVQTEAANSVADMQSADRLITTLNGGGKWKATAEVYKTKNGDIRPLGVEFSDGKEDITVYGADRKAIRSYLEKFLEWEKTARENRVQRVEKEIGVIGGGDFTQAFRFVVYDGMPSLYVSGKFSGRELSADGVKEVVALMERLPELDAKVAAGDLTPKDPTKALFK